MGGIPQNMKWAWVTSPDKAEPSKDALFLESESGEEVVDRAVVMEKFSSELRFEPRTPGTECSIPFNV